MAEQMTDFAPDQVNFGDPPGYGQWSGGHYREHLTFVQTFAAQTPPVLIPDYDLRDMLSAPKSARKSLVEAHAKMHVLMQQALGITGPDFTSYDLDNEGDFNSFLGYHATTHAQIRSALGLT